MTGTAVRRLLAAALTTGLLAGLPVVVAGPAAALSCVGPPAVLRGAEQVFTARIVEVDLDAGEVMVEVEDVWWGGPVAERLTLGLDLPGSTTADKGQTVLVWGGSTSVGCNAIQLAKAAGYRVVTTASPHNFDYLKSLGADEVYDYNRSDAAADIARALKGDRMAGALAIGAGSALACIAVLGACSGNRKVAIATFPVDIDSIPDRPNAWTMMTRMVPKMIVGAGGIWVAAKRNGVRMSSIWGSALMDTDLGPAIYERFLPDALRTGRFVAAPPPLVVGHGLDAIQPAFERQKKGVSAAKIVVTL